MYGDMDWPDIIELVMSFLLRGALLAALIIAILTGNWTLTYASGAAFLVSMMPVIIERRKKFFFPIEFELVLTAFVFASVMLGEGLNFYEAVWWWDLMLHAFSGVALGFVGFLIVYLISKEKRVRLTPIFVAIFSFSFAMALGAIWEIFEFTMDQVFGTIMQRGSLGDTMWDIIVAACGGIMASVIGYFYVKGGDSLIFERLTRKFVKENPKLFPKTYNQFKEIFQKERQKLLKTHNK